MSNSKVAAKRERDEQQTTDEAPQSGAFRIVPRNLARLAVELDEHIAGIRKNAGTLYYNVYEAADGLKCGEVADEEHRELIGRLIDLTTIARELRDLVDEAQS